MLPDPGEADESAPLFAWPRGALVLLSGVAVMSMVAEGAVLDWSALYMRDGTGAGPALSRPRSTARPGRLRKPHRSCAS